jgi:hypothetical protein
MQVDEKGLDVEAEQETLKPIMLVGQNPEDGKEVEIGVLGPEMLALSTFLRGCRSLDSALNELRVTVNVRPQILTLLYRFAQLVLKHNTTSPVSRRLPTPTPIPKNANPIQYLPDMIGHSAVLAEFVDIISEQPLLTYQCAAAAERLLWEPACTVFTTKFGALLHGLSIPFIELILQTDEQAIQRAMQHALELTDPQRSKRTATTDAAKKQDLVTGAAAARNRAGAKRKTAPVGGKKGATKTVQQRPTLCVPVDDVDLKSALTQMDLETSYLTPAPR